MTMIEYVVTMRRYWLLILVCTVLGGVNAYAYAEHQTVQYRVIEKSDHMFTALTSQAEFLHRTGDWLQEVAARSPRERPR